MNIKKTFFAVLMLCALTGCNNDKKNDNAGVSTDVQTEKTSAVTTELTLVDFTNEENSSAKEQTDTLSDETGDATEKKIFNCTAIKIDADAYCSEMTDIYRAAYADGKTKGYTPVFVVVDDVLNEQVETAYKSVGSADEYISTILSNDHSSGKQMLDDTYEELQKKYSDSDFLSMDDDIIDELMTEYTEHSIYLPSARDFDEEIYLLQVPTKKPYEVFAWVPFGGWNNCPDTDEMIAICKYWYDEYWVLPALITYDSLYMYLYEPITDMETAKSIAKEQSMFCIDVAGMGGMEGYVWMTSYSHVWNFWWD